MGDLIGEAVSAPHYVALMNCPAYSKVIATPAPGLKSLPTCAVSTPFT